MKVLHVVGARPNFMKVAPVYLELARRRHDQVLVHTGQHYDAKMSDVFFHQLGIGQPDINLEVGSGSHAQQTAQIMMRIEPKLLEEKPDIVLVYGDVNSTVAAALVCSKLGIRIGHVEAGLRSNDRTMPEEVNRLVTDALSDLLFTPSEDGNANLAREGVPAHKVHLVGNVMIDTLIRLLPIAKKKWEDAPLTNFAELERYGLATLHRPSNVDDPDSLRNLITTLNDLAAQVPIIFPIHPRTKARLSELGITALHPQLHTIEPLGYLEFLALQTRSTVVVTDSGGIQEETTYLGIPCITVRENTERPVTMTVGTNVLAGRDMGRVREEVLKVLRGKRKDPVTVPLWDGRAAERLVDILENVF